MATKLRDVRIDEISLVDRPANKGARILIAKRDEEKDMNVNSGIGLVGFAKIAVEQHNPMGLTRQVFEAGITKRAAEIRRAGETSEQAFTRALIEDEECKILFKASKIAPAADAKEDYVKERDEFSSRGPAHARMKALADLHRIKYPNFSEAGAIAYVYGHADNRSLADRVKAEHMAIARAHAS